MYNVYNILILIYVIILKIQQFLYLLINSLIKKEDLSFYSLVLDLLNLIYDHVKLFLIHVYHYLIIIDLLKTIKNS